MCNFAQNNAEIAISVLEDNTICLNRQKVTMEALKVELEKIKRQWPKACPQLFHDKKAQFGTYQNVKNALESAGFSEMDLILKPN